jgi:hypothetical protein
MKVDESPVTQQKLPLAKRKILLAAVPFNFEPLTFIRKLPIKNENTRKDKG